VQATGRLHVVTAKGGLAALTKGLALDLAPHHITVNCVVPGLINTTRGTSSAAQLPENRRTAVPPVGRRGEPEEVATVVRMLCGPESRFVTGQAIHVNGGTYMP
jgi:3-oxoacyl-[acyl-carrier protein] reductase